MNQIMLHWQNISLTLLVNTKCRPDCAEDIDVEDDKNKEGKKAGEGQPEPIYVVSEKYFLVSGKYFLVSEKYLFCIWKVCV